MGSKMKDKTKKHENNHTVAVADVCKCDEVSNISKLYAAITEDQLSQLKGYSIQQIEHKFSEIYNLPKYEVDLKEGSLLDCYVSAYWFAIEERMMLISTFILLNLIHELLKHCRTGMNLQENTEILKQYFPNDADDNVNNIEFKKILVYISENLFQHYKLYQFMFKHRQPQVIRNIQVLVESIPDAFMEQPPPLEESLEERLYFKYIQPIQKYPIEEKNTTEFGEKSESDVAVKTEEDICDDCQNKEITKDSPIEQLNVDNELLEVLRNMTADDIEALVKSIAEEKLNPLKLELNVNMKEREALLLSKMKKLQAS